MNIVPISRLTTRVQQFRCTVLPGTPVISAGACALRQIRAAGAMTPAERLSLKSCVDCSDGRRVVKGLTAGGDMPPPAAVVPERSPSRPKKPFSPPNDVDSAKRHAADQSAAASRLDAELAERMASVPVEKPAVSPPPTSAAAATGAGITCRGQAGEPPCPNPCPAARSRPELADTCTKHRGRIYAREHSQRKSGAAAPAPWRPLAPDAPPVTDSPAPARSTEFARATEAAELLDVIGWDWARDLAARLRRHA